MQGGEDHVVRLRLTRGGRRGRPFYRIVAADSRMPRDGRYLEVVGTYDPLQDPPAVTVKQERILQWLQWGAKPSVTVHHLLDRAGLLKRQPKDAATT
jgi:small subunit ribosomal protein S16